MSYNHSFSYRAYHLLQLILIDTDNIGILFSVVVFSYFRILQRDKVRWSAATSYPHLQILAGFPTGSTILLYCQFFIYFFFLNLFTGRKMIVLHQLLFHISKTILSADRFMIKVAAKMFPPSVHNGCFVSKQFSSIHRGTIIIFTELSTVLSASWSFSVSSCLRRTVVHLLSDPTRYLIQV